MEEGSLSTDCTDVHRLKRAVRREMGTRRREGAKKEEGKREEGRGKREEGTRRRGGAERSSGRAGKKVRHGEGVGRKTMRTG
jgi:hypothetical protein